MWVSTTKLAKIEGVTTQTIRRRIESGFYDKVKQTEGGHFRVFITQQRSSEQDPFMSIRPILADNSTSISEFKKNPMAVINEAGGFPVAILSHNKPAFYCVPADAYEFLMDKLEDMELAEIVRDRKNSTSVRVSLDDL